MLYKTKVHVLSRLVKCSFHVFSKNFPQSVMRELLGGSLLRTFYATPNIVFLLYYPLLELFAALIYFTLDIAQNETKIERIRKSLGAATFDTRTVAVRQVIAPAPAG